MDRERSVDTYTLPNVRPPAAGSSPSDRGTQTGPCNSLEGRDGEEDGREVQAGGDMGAPVADSC